jgi:hypothetical protein
VSEYFTNELNPARPSRQVIDFRLLAAAGTPIAVKVGGKVISFR